MKKITKVVLAAALVLLVAGAFTGAAAAVGPVTLPVSVVTAEVHIQGAAVQADEIYAASGVEGASFPNMAAAQVIVVEKKGKFTPGTPFTPSVPPFVYVKPATMKFTYVPGAMAALR